MNIELQKHYGALVHTNVNADILRKKECLCLNCEKLAKCVISKQLYSVCVKENIALMVTRCGEFIKSDRNSKGGDEAIAMEKEQKAETLKSYFEKKHLEELGERKRAEEKLAEANREIAKLREEIKKLEEELDEYRCN